MVETQQPQQLQRQQQQQPTSVFAPEAVVVQQRGGCCSNVPPNVSSAVENTRNMSVIIIAIHVIPVSVTFIGNFIGIAMGSVVLCSFSKATYTTAGVLYILGFIADAFSAFLMITWLHGVFDGGLGVAYEVFVLLLFVHAIVAPLTFLAGSVFAFKAVCTWEQGSGALRTSPVDMEHPVQGASVQGP